MRLIKTNIKDLFVIEPKIYIDDRGWFYESYNKREINKLGINLNFVQDNHSLSLKKGILRGLHFQNHPSAQTKLIRCVKEKIWDVVVDLRKTSETYLKWFSIELNPLNKKQLLIPKGFAHGFLTLEDNTEVIYKVDNYYDSKLDRTIKYNDPEIGIEWPSKNISLSKKDSSALNLKDVDVLFK